MANALDAYEIEEDSVRLVFKDGSSRLVGFDDLAVHLRGRELAKVKRAVTIRQNFIKTVLPPWAKVVVISVGAFAIAFNLNRVAGFFELKAPENSNRQTEAPAGSTTTTLLDTNGYSDSNDDSVSSPPPGDGYTGPTVPQHQVLLPITASPTAFQAVSGQTPISPNASPRAYEATQNNPSISQTPNANSAKK